MYLFVYYSPRTTAWTQEVEQRREQLPRHEGHEEKQQSKLRALRALRVFVVNFFNVF
jgi:hypothetical protein